MLRRDSRPALLGMAKTLLVVAVMFGCSERKPAGPPEGATPTTAPLESPRSADPTAEAR